MSTRSFQDDPQNVPLPASTAGRDDVGGPGGATGQTRSIGDLVRGTLARWWLVALATLAAISGAAVYSYLQPVVFTAAATVEIMRMPPMVMPIVDVIPAEVMSAEDLNTQISWLGSRAIAERVARRLTPDELRRLTEPFAETSTGDRMADAIEALDEGRRVVPLRLSLVAAVVFQHPDAALVPRVANLFAEEFIALKISTKTTEAFRVADELKDKADQQRRIVEQLSVAMQDYKEKHDVVSLDARRDIVTAGLREANARVSLLAARLLDAGMRRKAVADARAAGTPLVDLSVIAADGRVAALQAGVVERKIALGQLGNRYRSGHPRVMETAAGLASAERELAGAVEMAAMAVESEYMVAQETLDAVRVELAAQEKESLRLQRLAIEFEAIRRELNAAERLFNTILARMSETMLSGAIEVTNARIVDRATPAAPVGWIRHLKPLAIGTAGGLAGGAFLAFALALVDSRVRSRGALEQGIGLPVLAELPVLPRKPGPGVRARWIERAPRSAEAEAVRDLYGAIRLRSIGSGHRVLLITSAVGGEGKSLVAANLARCCARHGERTLLIDADLWRPAQHTWFAPAGATVAAGGLALLASGARPLDDLVRASDTQGLDVLLGGGAVPRTSALLGSAAFRDAVDQARRRYDRVIIDTAPIGAVSDAAILIGIADGCLMVVRQGRTRLETVKRAVQRLSSSTTPILGFVLNRTRRFGRSRHATYLVSPVDLPAQASPAQAG